MYRTFYNRKHHIIIIIILIVIKKIIVIKIIIIVIKNNNIIVGAKGDWDFRISVCSKTLMELIFNPRGEFRWSPEGLVCQIHSPHLHAPGIFSDLLRSVQMLKRERERGGCGKQREATASIHP